MELEYAVVFGCIVALGFPLNAVSLWILLRHHSLKSSTAVFMINLTISDLLLVISLPMRVYVYATGTWPLGKRACALIAMLFRNNIRSSSMFITIISVDRLLAVVYPMRSRHLRTVPNACKGAAVIWMLLLVLSIPESVNLERTLKNSSLCFQFRNTTGPMRTAYSYIQFVLEITLLAVNVVCTTMVSWTLRSHLSDSAQVNKVKVMLIFVMNLIMFTICFLPVSIGLLTLSPLALMPLVSLAAVNCCLDPLLYYFSFDAFWKKKENAEPARDQ